MSSRALQKEIDQTFTNSWSFVGIGFFHASSRFFLHHVLLILGLLCSEQDSSKSQYCQKLGSHRGNGSREACKRGCGGGTSSRHRWCCWIDRFRSGGNYLGCWSSRWRSNRSGDCSRCRGDGSRRRGDWSRRRGDGSRCRGRCSTDLGTRNRGSSCKGRSSSLSLTGLPCRAASTGAISIDSTDITSIAIIPSIVAASRPRWHTAYAAHDIAGIAAEIALVVAELACVAIVAASTTHPVAGNAVS
jgi:hypothetical protein